MFPAGCGDEHPSTCDIEHAFVAKLAAERRRIWQVAWIEEDGS
jgi:hypothetical protein